jgi:hypothetical protein
MNRKVLAEYREFRNRGYRAEVALRSARIVVDFRKMEERGLVRIAVSPEFEPYFDVYDEPDTKKERDEICRWIDLYGIWVVSSERACGCCGTFKTIDSIGMCVFQDASDPHENDYVVDLMASALKSTEEVCNA